MMEEINEISPQTAMNLINSGALLIDVREKNELVQKSFDLRNMKNIALSIFENNLLEIPKDEKLIFACHLGVRSYNVVQFLIFNGWKPENLFSLQGGIDAWEYAKLPVKFAARSFSIVKPVSSCGCGSESSGSCC